MVPLKVFSFIRESVFIFNYKSTFVTEYDILVHNACGPEDSGSKKVINRNKPKLEDGNLKEGWEHIDARHITGDHPDGAGDLFAPGTTRSQIEKATNTLIKKGARISDPSRRMQTFEKDIVINGKKDLIRMIVDSGDGNRIITIFPVRGGGH